jgi:hypothetical protein
MKETLYFSTLTELKTMVDRLLSEHGEMKVSIVNYLHGPRMVIEKQKDCDTAHNRYNLAKAQ